MTATLTRTWNIEFEQENLNKLIAKHAPHIPTIRKDGVRPPATEEEKSNFYDYWTATAGHDLFIVQAASKAIWLIPDPDLHLILSRQIGDDGAHAIAERVLCPNKAPLCCLESPIRGKGFWRKPFGHIRTIAFRERIIALTERDPIDDIRKEVERHWEFIGDVPYRNWLGFIAFELHYEHHILPQVVFNKRTSKIGDLELANKSSQRFHDDEAVHRETVANWWRKQFEKASQERKS